MKSTTATTLAALAVIAGALLACGGQAAVQDLEKLKEKTCGCGEDKACIDEAKTMAKEWVGKHKDARGGDQDKAEKLVSEILDCNMEVAMEIAKAAE